MSASTTMLILSFLYLLFSALIPSNSGNATCRSYCGNLTIDYPFALHSGCGHPGFRELLYCINDVLMFHISSGSYRVLDIDYAYQALTLHDPHMSTCDNIVLEQRVTASPSSNGGPVHESDGRQLHVDWLLSSITTLPRLSGKHLPCRTFQA
ncbi:uncharacterized protein Pyn_17688 [Prunus yedoensis var. nudiflora]|uniref:Wall-associated receptor kinase galacturonan-binding domain-containing protein n=1 Tax=Prunus yedoensis var. nudiflora TaxID=2094558 RepID=A0A314YNE9_PRUYE|nr:uncharacterized protein Pyn_17688 [Prunus yedoensis var. nudiflora]